MKVLHVIPSVAQRYGGPSQAIAKMCAALQLAGVEAVIATTNADGESVLPVRLGELFEYQGISTIFFNRQFSEALKYSSGLARWLEQHVVEFDVVHIHAVFSHACVAAAKACLRANVPYVVRPLGTLDPWSLQQKRWRKRVFWQLGVKQMLQGAAAIHYTTVAEQRLVETALGLQRGMAIALGTDESLFERVDYETEFWRAQPDLHVAPYVIVLCRLHPKKQLERLLASFLAVTKSDHLNKWRMLIVGDGEPDYVATLRQLSAEAAGRVIFAGWLQGADKAQALQQAQLYALTSRQENFGISVVEAMTCGLPVLISDHVNLADEIIEANAGWVVPLEDEALRDALTEALTNENLRLAKGAAGRQLVRDRYTWAGCAERLVSLYQRLSADRKNNG